MKSARARREEYVGTWLPEPSSPSPRETLAETSVALLLALERLSPLERAAFLLHDVFDMDFAAVGEVLDSSEAACRQLAARAREHVRDGPPALPNVERAEARKLADAFFAAAQGDVGGLAACSPRTPCSTPTAAASGARP